MTISDLSLQEKEELSKAYDELGDVINKQKELDKVTRPLNEELFRLTKEEEEYDLEYKNLYDAADRNNYERLTEISKKMVDIAKSKNDIKKKLDEYEPEFEKLRQEEEEYNVKIEHIINREKEGVLGQGMVYLDKDGKVVDSIEEINITTKKFQMPTNTIRVNLEKNQIIQTDKSVVNFLKNTFDKVSEFKTKITGEAHNIIDFMKKELENTKSAYKEYYDQEEKKVNSIIENYMKEKEEEKELENKAENLTFVGEGNSLPINEEVSELDKAMYVNDDSNIINGEVTELEQSKEEISTPKNDTKEVENEQNNYSMPEANIAENIRPIESIKQLVDEEKSKVAGTDKEKIGFIQKITSKVGQINGKIQASKKLSELREDQLRKLREAYKSQQEALNSNYINDLNNIATQLSM